MDQITENKRAIPAGYKLTEVGVIPEDWDVVPLSELLEFKNGLNKSKQFFGYGTPIVNYMDVFSRSGLQAKDIAGCVDVSQRELAAYEVRKGDVFFTRTSETIGEIGIASVMLDEPEKTVFSGFVLRARPYDESLDNTFKAYCFTSSYFRQQITSRASYTTRALTNGRSLSAVLLARPPIPEQRAIAAALSDVDALLNGLDRLITKKRDIKQATMQQLLTGQTRLPGFEERWKTKTLDEVVTFLSGGTPSKNNENYWNGDIPWISATSLRTFFIWRSDSNVTNEAVAAGSKMAPVGSTLLLVRGSALHNEILAGLVTKPVCFNQDVKALVPSNDLFPKFLTTLLLGMAKELLKLVSSAGNTAGVLDTKLLKAFKIPLPSVQEQTAIAEVLSDLDAEITALEARRDKTRALKQGMMQELLTGRTRLVPPASVEVSA